eukprot:COSAG02_NODE_45050_length_360_cov_1.762452_2_plen_64_part_01
MHVRLGVVCRGLSVTRRSIPTAPVPSRSFDGAVDADVAVLEANSAVVEWREGGLGPSHAPGAGY